MIAIDVWWWPEWLPIQSTERNTELAVLDKRIRHLQQELLFLSEWEQDDGDEAWQ